MIKMFSTEEWILFGISMFVLGGLVLLAYLFVNSIEQALKPKHRATRWYELDENEFTRIGENALRQQRMLSVIAETEIGGTVEFMKGDTDELHGV